MNIYELQENEHQKILHLLQTVRNTTNPDHVGDAFNRFRVEWSAHKIAEEQTFFRLMQEKQPEMVNLIDDIRVQHANLEEQLTNLRRDNPEWDELDRRLHELEAVLLKDIKEEEQLMAEARNFLSEQEADNIANEMSACKLDFELRLLNRLSGSAASS